MRGKRKVGRILAGILAFVMMVTSAPTTVYATEPGSVAETPDGREEDVEETEAEPSEEEDVEEKETEPTEEDRGESFGEPEDEENSEDKEEIESGEENPPEEEKQPEEQEKPDFGSEGGDSGKEPDNLRLDKKVLNGGGNKIKGAGGQPFGEYQTGGLPCSVV